MLEFWFQNQALNTSQQKENQEINIHSDQCTRPNESLHNTCYDKCWQQSLWTKLCVFAKI